MEDRVGRPRVGNQLPGAKVPKYAGSRPGWSYKALRDAEFQAIC